MVFEYTYTGKLLKEIESREKEIAMLKEDVREMIVKNDYHLLQTYEELLEKMDDFPKFKKEKESQIEKYLINKLSNISNDILFKKIKDKNDESLTSMNIGLAGMTMTKEFSKITNDEILKPLFQAYISHNETSNENKEFIKELYNYTGTSITKLYNKDTFKNFTPDMKINCFRDTIQDIHNNIREWQIDDKIGNNGFVFQRLTEMMQDEDIKDLLSRHFAPEITSLENYARILSEYYPVSNDVFEDGKKMPKTIEEFIDAVENFGKEKTEEELEL